MSLQKISIPLSERELQVLQMVATGASNQQIAKELVISINTVKVHMRNIFEKLEVQSRTEASTRAIQEGWVTGFAEDALEASDVPPRKTFLLTETSPPPLRHWQQIYFTIAVLLTLTTAITPVIFSEPSSDPPYIGSVRIRSSSSQLYNQADSPAPDDSVSHWTPHSPMTISRAGLGVVAFAGKLYAIGGVKTSNRATRNVEIYDPGANTWVDGAAKPTAVTDIGSVVFQDKIYIPGGCNNENQAIDKLEIYQPDTDEWLQGPLLPASRCGYGLTGLNNKLYLFGGWDGENFTDTVFVYAPTEEQWTVLETSLPKPIGYMGVAVLGEAIYLVGGYNGTDEANETYHLDPVTVTWTKKASMHEKRGGLGLITVNEHLYAIGGGWEHPLEANEEYDPLTDTWTAFETPFTAYWRNLGVAVIDSRIYAVGGWDGTNNEFMNDLTSYNVLFKLFLPISSGPN
jgi:DNA-binding CsgD family transcriptional regulator/N-acetylneuraminic acid mutarotase